MKKSFTLCRYAGVLILAGFLAFSPIRSWAVANRAPVSGEAMTEIKAALSRDFGIVSEAVTLKDLQELPAGKSGQFGDWFEGGYFPSALGGYDAQDGAFDRFLKRIDSGYQKYIKEEGNENRAWGGYCSDFPKICERAMYEVCQESKVHEQALDSPYRRLIQALKDSGFSEKQISEELATVGPSNRFCRPSLEYWWGVCHLEPYVQTAFPKQPKEVKVKSQTLGVAELSVAAFLVVDSAGGRSRSFRAVKNFGLSGRPDHGINASSFIYALYNAYSRNRGRTYLAMDNDLSDEVWNYLIESYSIASISPVEQPLALATYAKIRGAMPAYNAESFQKVELNYKLLGEEETASVSAILEFNHEQQLVGAEWTGGEVPDFLWIVSPRFYKNVEPSPVRKQLMQWLQRE